MVSVGPATAIDRVADLVCTGLLLSLALTTKVDVPLAVGVPEITPVPAARVSPAGKLPDAIDHAYPGVPPLAAKVCAYAVPSVPAAKEEVEIASCDDLTVSESDADLVWAGFPLSVTLTVNLKVPLAVGVPVIAPLPAPRLSPAGRLPDVIDQA